MPRKNTNAWELNAEQSNHISVQKAADDVCLFWDAKLRKF